ncbi:hypothetical protein J4H86_20580 [Spiractinospora alimapuensis]|uniref:hypothetical protein n=1 Tax=Spiractinospora alimapuensis TaxID=2820884 RepID=UPI001F41E6EA|nr:hypothetical protein [Spiractinospora alimapuensis]QVQ51197.1 hypothetical protein J4H86_20580 [Spiractinospora alimapuensis]
MSKIVRRAVATGLLGGALALAFPTAAMAESEYEAGGSAASGWGAFSWSVEAHADKHHAHYKKHWDAAGYDGAASGYVHSGSSSK